MSYAIVRYFGVRHYGAINGVLTIVTGIGVGLGPPLVSFLHERAGTYRLPFLVAAGLAVGSAIFFVVLAFYPFYEEPVVEIPAGGAVPEPR
jgi:MFS family permease